LAVNEAQASEVPQENDFSDLGFEPDTATQKSDFSDLGFIPQDDSLRNLLAEDVRLARTPDEPIAQNAVKEVLAAGERYPQGIMKTIENLQTGEGSKNPLANIFAPNPDKRHATEIAQDIGSRVLPEAVIKDPNSHVEYLQTYVKEFGKNLPFTIAGVASELANPINALIGGGIAKLPHVNIPAPKFVDDAISGFIKNFHAPLSSLNDAAKKKLTDSIVDEIYTKVEPRVDELKANFKQVYGREATTADIKNQIRAKLDSAGMEEKNVVGLTNKLLGAK